jgi:cytochrome c biogenesis protein CcdA
MADHGERLASLEADNQHHKDTLSDVVDQLKTLNTQVSSINRKIDKNMGFIAGVAFVFSLLGAVFGLFGGIIMKKLGGT